MNTNRSPASFSKMFETLRYLTINFAWPKSDYCSDYCNVADPWLGVQA